MDSAITTYRPRISNIPNYVGRHRVNTMPHGVGYFPMGDRQRDRTEFGISYEEERGGYDISSSKKR